MRSSSVNFKQESPQIQIIKKLQNPKISSQPYENITSPSIQVKMEYRNDESQESGTKQTTFYLEKSGNNLIIWK